MFFWLSSCAKLGLSMETLLDSSRGIVQKGLLGGVGLRRRRFSHEQNVMDFAVLHSTDHIDCTRDDHPPTPTPRQPDSLPWEPTRSQDKGYFWERIEAPLPPLRPRPKFNFIHPRQLSPFPERLELPFSSNEILCGYEDIVSSGTDHFAAWVNVSPHELLVQ